MTDHLGSTRYVASSKDSVGMEFRRDYYPFGEDYSASGSVTDYKFTGKEQDESGLYYYGARYYDPRIGRFLTPDPLWIIDPTINPYHYCHNNPVNLIDPTGMAELDPELRREDTETQEDPLLKKLNPWFWDWPHEGFTTDGSAWVEKTTERLAQQSVSEADKRFREIEDNINDPTPLPTPGIKVGSYNRLKVKGVFDQVDKYRVSEFQLIKENFFATVDVLKSLVLDPNSGMPVGGTFSILPPSVANRLSLYSRGMKRFYYRNAYQINDVVNSVTNKYGTQYVPFTRTGRIIKYVSPFIPDP